jgi:CheY-like chemotaxis protein
VLRLPLRDADGVGLDNGTSPRTPAHAGRNVLVVDDEAEVALILSEMLTALGMRCDLVTSGEAAIERLEGRGYDVIICDMRLPGIDGPALYAWIAERLPHLCARTAFVTGDTLGQASERFLAQVRRPLLEKPFLPSDVARLIDQLLSITQ